MALIDRTAYPRLKAKLSAKELEEIYTPTPEEIQFSSRQNRSDGHRLCVLLLLKCFRRLGYFPVIDEIPEPIVRHIAAALYLHGNTKPAAPLQHQLFRYHDSIRVFLSIRSFRTGGMRIASTAMSAAALVMEDPADVINTAIETLVKEKIELPAYRTLDDLARKIRSLVNRRIFTKVHSNLSAEEMKSLDSLLDVESGQKKSALQLIKQLPKRSSLQHFQRLLDHIVRLSNFVDPAHLLQNVPDAKTKYFAALAKSLDASEIREFSPPKRYTCLLALIARAKLKAHDDLAAMYIKRIGTLHRRAKDQLDDLRSQHRQKTEQIVATLSDVIGVLEREPKDEAAGKEIRQLFGADKSLESVRDDCLAINAYSGDNYYPLMWKLYKSHRPTIFRMVKMLSLSSASEDKSLIQALDLVIDMEKKRIDWIEDVIDLSFANERWKRVVIDRSGLVEKINRRNLEVCVFSCLANELKSGDIAMAGSEEYADYRNQLLSWDRCQELLPDYLEQLGFPSDANGFVDQLKVSLTELADKIDRGYPENKQVVIDDSGHPVLKKVVGKVETPSAKALEATVLERLPERNILDVLSNVSHWVGFDRHFGPLSHSDTKIDRPRERYLLTTFTYGCNLGPVQASKHFRGAASPHELSFVNRRHVNSQKLDAANRDIINTYNTLDLPKVWGDGSSAAADGTKYDMHDQNLLAEYHIRYGGYGGIAYHHVSDTYAALFSHFIPCGVWEAVYIIEGLLKNTSDIQPDTIHADTQGQSTPVFALAYLLGIDLMPRIRNWQELKFFRPSKESKYQHIDSLFKDVIDWDLLKTHWKDLMQVVLSISEGKISSATLLRKLGNDSRKNKLYQAFRELGRVVRTKFLLKYISDIELREKITATTNKVESYNQFSKWNFFGGEGIIADNDPEEQEKIVKYNDLISNAIILSNAIDITKILRDLAREGLKFTKDDVAKLSPYQTTHIKRFGDYMLNAEDVPEPILGSLGLF